MVEKTEVVIIGGGIAGAATAYFLAQRGCQDVILLEKEPLPGMHSSGRNAAMIRQNVPEEINCRLAIESMRFFIDPPENFPLSTGFRKTGSLLLASRPALETLHSNCTMQKRLGLEVQCLSSKEALERVPILNENAFEGAFFCPSDGTIDINALLQGFLKGAGQKGASIRTQTEVESIKVTNCRAIGVRTNRGEIEAKTIVNAAGAWAGSLAKTAGLSVPIRPCRRHLVVTQPLPWVDPNWPFTWDVSGGFYFRPESGGLLMSPCDEEESPPSNTPTDEEIIAEAAEKAIQLIPKLADAGVAYAWAGLRNLTPDHLFIVGEDPTIQGFFWVAGLGGHGITASPAAGRIAADLILDGKTDILDPAPLSPARFSGK